MDEPDDSLTYARVRLPSSVYRRIKAAAALRGVGQGDLIRQILAEHVEAYLNFDGDGTIYAPAASEQA